MSVPLSWRTPCLRSDGASPLQYAQEHPWCGDWRTRPRQGKNIKQSTSSKTLLFCVSLKMFWHISGSRPCSADQTLLLARLKTTQDSWPLSTPVPLSSLLRRLRLSAFISSSFSFSRDSMARRRSRRPSISPAAQTQIGRCQLGDTSIKLA